MKSAALASEPRDNSEKYNKNKSIHKVEEIYVFPVSMTTRKNASLFPFLRNLCQESDPSNITPKKSGSIIIIAMISIYLTPYHHTLFLLNTPKKINSLTAAVTATFVQRP